MKILHEAQNLQRWHVTYFGGIYSRITHQSVRLEAKKKMEEQQTKIALEQAKREKQEFLSAKQKMLDQLKRDKEERFGKKIEGGE